VGGITLDAAVAAAVDAAAVAAAAVAASSSQRLDSQRQVSMSLEFFSSVHSLTTA
jgi:hypothetical protein